MPNRYLRALLVVEFLIALQAVWTFWTEVGGQYHLDLMYWAWKFGLSLAAALLIVVITADLVRSDGAGRKKIWLYGSLLAATIAVAGLVTYYYHLHEPSDDNTDDQATSITGITIRGDSGCRKCFLVRMRGLEPPRHFWHMNLNHARLPVPPHPQDGRTNSDYASGCS